MPPYKVEQLLSTAGDFIAAEWFSLEETQIIAGRVSHLAQMMPFLRAFRCPLNDLLGEFGDDKEILLRVRPELAADLKFCAYAAITALHWLPIAPESGQPPADAWKFVSDAWEAKNGPAWLRWTRPNQRKDLVSVPRQLAGLRLYSGGREGSQAGIKNDYAGSGRPAAAPPHSTTHAGGQPRDPRRG
jgi:hypothetical protein